MRRGIIAGNFDVIHPGYVRFFKDAKENACEWVIVALHVDRRRAAGRRQAEAQRGELPVLRRRDDRVHAQRGEHVDPRAVLQQLLQQLEVDVRGMVLRLLGHLRHRVRAAAEEVVHALVLCLRIVTESELGVRRDHRHLLQVLADLGLVHREVALDGHAQLGAVPGRAVVIEAPRLLLVLDEGGDDAAPETVDPEVV